MQSNSQIRLSKEIMVVWYTQARTRSLQSQSMSIPLFQRRTSEHQQIHSNVLHNRIHAYKSMSICQINCCTKIESEKATKEKSTPNVCLTAHSRIKLLNYDCIAIHCCRFNQLVHVWAHIHFCIKITQSQRYLNAKYLHNGQCSYSKLNCAYEEKSNWFFIWLQVLVFLFQFLSINFRKYMFPCWIMRAARSFWIRVLNIFNLCAVVCSQFWNHLCSIWHRFLHLNRQCELHFIVRSDRK